MLSIRNYNRMDENQCHHGAHILVGGLGRQNRYSETEMSCTVLEDEGGKQRGCECGGHEWLHI